jgi:hypothetical protein
MPQHISAAVMFDNSFAGTGAVDIDTFCAAEHKNFGGEGDIGWIIAEQLNKDIDAAVDERSDKVLCLINLYG